MDKQLLSEILLRVHLGEEECQYYGKRTNYRRGDFVYLPTDRLDTLFILNQGVVKLGSYSPTGTEVTYDLVCSGEFFGNLQYISNNTFSEFAKALSPVEIYSYPLALFKEAVQRDAAIAERFHEVIVRRWCRAETKLFSIASLRPKERVQRLLQQYNQKVAIREGGFVSISDLLTQKDIADLTGLTRQTVAHIMKVLRRNEVTHRIKAT